nr:hypothetical protein [Streptomyces sp. SCL15-4]
MTGPAVLLRDAAGPESAALTRAAAARGQQVHAATSEAARREPAAKLAGQVITDFTRPAREQITAYARQHDVGAVLTVNEYLTELTSLVCAELGLPGNDSHLAQAARDKAVVARALAGAGVRIPTPGSRAVTPNCTMPCTTARSASPVSSRPTARAPPASPWSPLWLNPQQRPASPARHTERTEAKCTRASSCRRMPPAPSTASSPSHRWRAVATRFDKLAARYRAGVLIASLVLWLRNTTG